ncbi:MAG: hypothetical protein ACHQC8_00725 [Solirubrobacterales bacterium]
MTTSHLRWSGAPGGVHPVVLDRRLRDLVRLSLSALIPAALALVITVELRGVSLLLILASIVGVLGIVALILSSRIEVTVALLGVYLGMLNGPIKLSLGGRELTAAIPNILILAVCLGAVMRIVVRRERVRMPPLSGWVVAFVGIVLIEAFNPNTSGILHILGGFRQQLQWVPFFFFGYVLMRSKKRFRQVFLIVGVAALANGVVSAYQSGLSPAQLASWGQGYHTLIYPTTGTGRTFSSEGEGRVRPPALGSEAGAGGGVGVLALPFALALLATASRWRRRWVAVLLCLGAIVAIATGLGRLQVVGAGIGVIAFAALASVARQRVMRVVGALLAILILTVPTGLFLVSVLRKGTLKRYESISVTSSSTTLHKRNALALVVPVLEAQPFGLGLGTEGPVGAFGGKNASVLGIGEGTSPETQFNFIANELGAPGLAVWVALSFYLMALVAFAMRRVRDPDLAIYLAAAFAPFYALFIEGSSGPLSNSASAGPYFWFAIGIAAYWLAGPGRRSPLMAPAPSLAAPAVTAKAI